VNYDDPFQVYELHEFTIKRKNPGGVELTPPGAYLPSSKAFSAC